MSAQPASYGTGPIKRRSRRTKAEVEAIKGAIYGILSEDHPQTVRQLYYRLTSAGVIAKTEQEYKSTVTRLLAEMRREGAIPYTWLADSTRWMRRPKTYSSIEEALRRTASTYRRALWDDAPCQVEIWLEKEALAGVLVEVTEPWDVPLMVCKGYPSMSFTHSAAEAIGGRGDQVTQIYYFGDHDPSGKDIERTIVNNIGESLLAMYDWTDTTITDPVGAFSYFARFERVAVTPDQITDMGLQTRPTKTTDTRSKHFEGESVEVDAILNPVLRSIAEQAITQHVDQHKVEVLRKVEQEEQDGLLALAEGRSS